MLYSGNFFFRGSTYTNVYIFTLCYAKSFRKMLLVFSVDTYILLWRRQDITNTVEPAIEPITAETATRASEATTKTSDCSLKLSQRGLQKLFSQ